ncbi:MAG: DUF1294 domain-containing protein [Pseudomonadota bacterium]
MIYAFVAAIFLAVNAVGAILFVHDKRSAERGKPRVPERLLLALAAAGASPVMLWLSGKIRHKTRKQPFRGILLGIGAVQLVAAIAALAWYWGIL